MWHTWPPRIVSLTYGMVRNERKKRKKEKKDGNKTEMNESYKVQLKSWNALINILKFSTQICCYEASLFYYCYHCSRCCWTGSSCPCPSMCTCHSVMKNSLSDFLFDLYRVSAAQPLWTMWGSQEVVQRMEGSSACMEAMSHALT